MYYLQYFVRDKNSFVFYVMQRHYFSLFEKYNKKGSKSFVDMHIETQTKIDCRDVCNEEHQVDFVGKLNQNAFLRSIREVISFFVVSQQVVLKYHPCKCPGRTWQRKNTLHILPTDG